jgi:predicted RNase H-like HicB family nuclease
MKTLSEKKPMLYPVAIEKGNSKTAFGVVVPDIKGCFSSGDSIDNAILNAKEAIELHLDLMCDDNLPIPQATSIEVFANKKEFKGWFWALIDVDITPYLGKSQKINVTLPEHLIKKIDAKVATEKLYKTRSGFLAQAAINQLRMQAASAAKKISKSQGH